MAKIMIVEDEAITALSIRVRLKSLGYSVCALLSDGEAAVKSVATERPDLIIMDIGLPGKIDGIEAAKRIQSHYNIPIIFITGYFDQNLDKEVREINPSFLLTKPFSPSDIEQAIEEMLAPRPKHSR